MSPRLPFFQVFDTALWPPSLLFSPRYICIYQILTHFLHFPNLDVVDYKRGKNTIRWALSARQREERREARRITCGYEGGRILA